MPADADPAAGPLFYDQRRLPDMEVERRNQEVISEQRRAEDERRREAETAARKKVEDARQAEQDRRLAAEAEANRKADEERRIAAEAEANRKADEEKRLAAEAEARRKADEEKRVAVEAEARRKADEQQRIAAEAEAKRKADEEKRIAAEAEASRKADEEKRIAAEAEASRRAAAARVAAIIPQVAAPAATGACGAAKIDAAPLPGGIVQIGVDSACRRGQIIVVHYSEYDLTRKLGPNGQLVFAVDMFLGQRPDFSIGFADGSTQTVALPAIDLSATSKVALIWQAPVDLDLHAIEGGGAFGKAGHRWSGAASNLDAATAEATESGRGSGYLSTVDTGTREGTKIEVYTFIHNADQESGAVGLLVDYASRGSSPSGDKCGTGALAEIAFDVVVLDRKGRTTSESGIVPAVPCGAPLPANARYLRGAISDLRFKN